MLAEMVLCLEGGKKSQIKKAVSHFLLMVYILPQNFPLLFIIFIYANRSGSSFQNFVNLYEMSKIKTHCMIFGSFKAKYRNLPVKVIVLM